MRQTPTSSVGFYFMCSPFFKRNNYVSKPPFPVLSTASFHINAICMRHPLPAFNNSNLHFLFALLSDSFTYHVSIFNTDLLPCFVSFFFNQEIDFFSFNHVWGRAGWGDQGVLSSPWWVQQPHGQALTSLSCRELQAWPPLPILLPQPWTELGLTPCHEQGTTPGFPFSLSCDLTALPLLRV